jgi:hypothetical protein
MLQSTKLQKQQSVHLYHRRTHSAPSTPTANSASQTSHGREQEDYPPLPPSSAIHADRSYFNSPQPSRRSRSNGSLRRSNLRITYESPRLYHSDVILFPASKHGPLHNTSYLQSYDERYQYIQSLQGATRLAVQTDSNGTKDYANDMSILRINYSMIHDRKISPRSVHLGILPQCAQRIRSLHCPILPQQLPKAGKGPKVLLKAIISWLDMIVHTFPNLQHLYIQAPPLERDSLKCESAKGSVVPPALLTTEEMKLFHSFVVYRIPNLQTIDGVSITAQDRKEAMLLKRVKAASTTKCTRSPIRNKKLPLNAQPVSSCLLDGMEDDDDENNDPAQEDNIQATETVVEVRQPSSEKKEATHRPSTDRVIRSPDGYSNQHFFAASRGKSTEEEQWEYVSVGESSVHAMGACASWTTACGSLSSALPYFLQKRTADPNRLKMKLLQNRKRMIQGNIPTATNQNGTLHNGGTDCRLDPLPVERDQPSLDKPSTFTSLSKEEKTPLPPSRSNLARSMPNAPPTQSLPSPLQSRSQQHGIFGKTLPDVKDFEASKGIQALGIATNQVVTSQNADALSAVPVVPPAPRVSTSRAGMSSDASLVGTTDQDYDLTRTRSSPSKLPSSELDTKAKPSAMTASLTIQTKTGVLPPPCPGAIRRKISSVINRSTHTTGPIQLPTNISQCSSSTKASIQHRKEHVNCNPSISPWRDAMSLRTFSLLDDDDNCNDGFVHSDDEDM